MRSAALIVALLVLTGSLVGPAAAVVSDDAAQPQVDQQQRITEPITTDIVVALQANGSARWTVTMTYALDSEVQRAAFEEYRAEFERGNAPGLNVGLFEALAAEGSQSADRTMRIRSVAYRTSVTEDTGSLTLVFTWTNFLERPDRDTLRFHDAVLLSEPNPGERLWLSTLDENQTMTIRTPPGYSVNSTQAPSFEFENNSVVIEGPQRFEGDLTITYQQSETVGGDTPWALVVGALVIAAGVVVAAVVLRRREDEDRPPSMSANGEGSDTGVEPPSDGGDEDHDEPPDDSETVDLSLLSDEERVERLLERNGGRMKQATIVRETGWSDAKVSQLLSAMADADRVEKLRLGRENLISLPDDGERDDE
jgi:hypothetical protein